MTKPKLREVRDIHRNAGAIRMARQVCRELESGAAIGLGVVVVRRSGSVATSWDAGPAGSHQMHSGAHSLAQRVGQALLDGANE